MKISVAKTFIFVLMIAVVALAGAEQAFAAEKPTVLITAFDPFMNFPVNSSKDVAEGVQYRLEQAGYQIEVCILPVIYDVAAQKAIECFNKLPQKPAMVISLGEGACDTEIEDIMENFDSTPGVADNAGSIREGSPIVKGLPSQITLSPFTKRLYCGVDQNVRSKVFPSTSAGNFVCNNTGFHLGLQFKQQKINYAFLHVPSHTCGADPMESADKIAKMIKGAYKTPSQECVEDFNQRASTHKSFEILN